MAPSRAIVDIGVSYDANLDKVESILKRFGARIVEFVG